jgi:hypothetical protein
MVGDALGSIIPTIITAHISASRANSTLASASVPASGRIAAPAMPGMPSAAGISIMPPVISAIPSIWLAT